MDELVTTALEKIDLNFRSRREALLGRQGINWDIHKLKLAELVMFTATPILDAEQAAKGISRMDLSMSILRKDLEWREQLAPLEAARQQFQASVMQATTPAEIEVVISTLENLP